MSFAVSTVPWAGMREDYCVRLANSFMVSADNAHAVHPNHPDKSDPENRVYPNRGIVIKCSANQKYTTDGVSSAIFRTICERAKVPYQIFRKPFRYGRRFHTRKYFQYTGCSEYRGHRTGSACHALPVRDGGASGIPALCLQPPKRFIIRVSPVKQTGFMWFIRLITGVSLLYNRKKLRDLYARSCLYFLSFSAVPLGICHCITQHFACQI